MAAMFIGTAAIEAGQLRLRPVLMTCSPSSWRLCRSWMSTAQGPSPKRTVSHDSQQATSFSPAWHAPLKTLPTVGSSGHSSHLYYGWVIVALGFLAQGMTSFSNQGLSTYITPLQREFGWSIGATAADRSFQQVD